MISKLHETSIIRSIDIKSYIKSMAEFILKNRNDIQINDKIRESISSEVMMKTIIADLFKLIKNEEKLSMFSFLDLSSQKDIPEGFLFTHWNLDVSTLQDFMKDQFNILSTFPEINSKILYNITNIISSKQDKITDLSKLQQTVIRDFLSRSYSQCKDNWPAPNILYYLVKSYSLVLANSIGKSYNLQYPDQMFIATVLAVFFLQKCHNKSSLNPMLNRLDFLSKFIVIKEITDIIEKDYPNKELSIVDVCDIIRKYGNSRLYNFNQSSLFQIGRATNPNPLVSLISLEYPPYWFFSLLLAMSGMKTNLYHSLKNMNMMKDMMTFNRELLQNRHLIHNTF